MFIFHQGVDSCCLRHHPPELSQLAASNVLQLILRRHSVEISRLVRLLQICNADSYESRIHRRETSNIQSEKMIEDQTTAPVDKATSSESIVSKKRKRAATSTSQSRGPVVDLTQQDDSQYCYPPAKKKKASSSRKAKYEEKRLRRFRAHAPSSYLERLRRATTQRSGSRNI